jgi:hypothetical protein
MVTFSSERQVSEEGVVMEGVLCRKWMGRKEFRAG